MALDLGDYEKTAADLRARGVGDAVLGASTEMVGFIEGVGEAMRNTGSSP